MMGLEAAKYKGVKARNGSTFRTICKSCNSALGVCDGLVGDVYKKITRQILSHFRSINSFVGFASAPINPVLYARSLIGHILAATSDNECRSAPGRSEYFDPLKRFVLGDDSALDETHDIYYWFYPRDRHLSAKFVAVHNKGHQAFVSILSFFPIAFMVTMKNQGIYPAQAIKLSLSDECLTLNLSTHNIGYVDFPFVPLTGDQYYMLADEQAVVSYPEEK